MKKLHNFTARKKDLMGARINRAWSSMENGLNVKFIQNNVIIRGVVGGVWLGKKNRLVVLDDFGGEHHLTDLTKISVFSFELGDYIPIMAYADQKRY